MAYPQIMGIVNVTPDSFSDGGQFLNSDRALRQIERLIQEGADFIDLGAESTRPGAVSISEGEEIRRLEPILKKYKSRFDTPLSVDTTRARVASLALDLGAGWINDISSFRQDSAMPNVIAKYKAGVMLMHSQGTPQTMQDNPVYSDVVSEVKSALQEAAGVAKAAGIRSIILDPGIGFGKNTVHNLTLLCRIDSLIQLGYPVMVGVSRKSVIGQVTGAAMEDRLAGTIAANVAAFLNGAQIFRVHDVKENRQALQMAHAIRDSA